jgi:hypothetical protein
MTKVQLYESFYPHVIQFIAEESSFISAAHPDAEMVLRGLDAAQKKVMPKPLVIQICSIPFLSRELYYRFIGRFDLEVGFLMEKLTLEGPLHYKMIARDWQIETVEFTKEPQKKHHFYRDDQEHTKVKKAFSLLPYHRQAESYFRPSNDIIFYLPEDLRNVIVPFLVEDGKFDIPVFPELDTSGEELAIFMGEEVLMRELPGLLIHLNEKRPRMSVKGRPYANSLKGIRKKLDLTEFYDEPKQDDLDYIRINMLLSLLLQEDKLSTESPPEEIVKKLFNEVYPYHFRSALHLLSPYIKGITSLREFAFRRVENHLLALMKGITREGWIRYEDFERSLQLRVFSVGLLEGRHAHDIYFAIPAGFEGVRWETQVTIYPFFQERYIMWPAMKGTLFLMAAWGLLDICYRTPNCKVLSQTCNSPYDGIYALRLTNLGAYVLGHTKTYTSDIRQPFTFSLSEDALSILLVDGDMKLASRALASFARPLGEKRFQTNADLFLANCNTAADLQHKINLFSSLFPGELPGNWQAFFTEISRKADPLTEEHSYQVFKISPDDRTLLQLIARDEQIKDLCIKAEGHRILVRKNDLKKLRTLLRGHGYLVE